MSSSSNPSFIVELVGDAYPFPLHISSPNLVTVKLSGKDKYNVWKTQMLCLLTSHNMLGFINGTFVRPQVINVMGDIEAWIRSDALIKSWILGSLSEEVAINIVDRFTSELGWDTADFTAKDAWDELSCIYGTPAVLQQATEEEITTREAKSIIDWKSMPKNAKSEDESEEKQKEREKMIHLRADVQRSLYHCTRLEDHQGLISILEEEEVTVNQKITINGNSTLHMVVGSSKNVQFLERVLEKTPNETLMDVRNSEGSTLLHVAAIVGNTQAARILLRKNQGLLISKDDKGRTPLAFALSNMHTETSEYLFNSIKSNIEFDTLFSGTSGDELLVIAISSKNFRLACRFQKHYRTVDSDAVLMAIAQNFPCELKFLGKKTKFKPLRWINSGRRWIPRCVLLCGSWMEKRGIPFIFGSLMIRFNFLTTFMMLARPFTKERVEIYDDATTLLLGTCSLISSSIDPSSHHHYYTNPILEATKQNAIEVVNYILYYFPSSIWSVNKDGHNVIQCAVINRSEKIYNLLYLMSDRKNVYKTIKDSSGNNLLHLAAKLAPANKLNLISGAALQIQHELQWFKEVEGFVCPQNTKQENSSQETPQMVFTREHKELVVEGEKWMKATAESYTITAALITTIVFAAAITVPGGNNQEGIPVFTNNTAFTIFAISDAISLFTSVTSLLMFLSILTARFAEQDFLFKLPTKLVIGLATLFISTTAMIIAFGATLFLVFGQNNSRILISIAALTCLPITSFVTLQFPLVVDFMRATYGRSIFGKKEINSAYFYV